MPEEQTNQETVPETTPPADTGLLECDVCHEKFSGLTGLRTHKRWAHSKAGRAKMMAATAKATKTRLAGKPARHLRTKRGKIQCPLCDHPPFTSDSGIRYHMQVIHHRGIGFSANGQLGGGKCPECGYESSAQGIAVHRAAVHGVKGAYYHIKKKNKTKECPYCEFVTTTKKRLKVHMDFKHPGETGIARIGDIPRSVVDAAVYFDDKQEQEQHKHIKFCPACGEDLARFMQNVLTSIGR